MAVKRIRALLAASIALCAAVLSFAPPASAAGAPERFVNVYAGLCLDARYEDGRDPYDNGDPVQLWGCDGTASNQLWVVQTPGGWGPITNATSGKCLDALLFGSDTPTKNGDKVQLWDCNGGEQQRWNIIDVGGFWAICNGYALQHGKTMCLDAENDRDWQPNRNGDPVKVWEWLATYNQQWY